jgi:hypothetical protein
LVGVAVVVVPVVVLRVQVENGYHLWTYQGVRVHEEPKAACYYVVWRPRLRGLLSDEEIVGIKRDLKDRIKG